jgi:hypothetical protein
MLHLKSEEGNALRKVAIFTATIGPFNNLLA